MHVNILNMKTIDKYKKKLKRWEWCNKHLGTLILCVYFPLLTLNVIFLPIAPIFAISCLVLGLFSVVIGGCVKLFYADEKNHKLLFEKQIAAMETVSEEKIEVLERSIKNFQANPTLVKDKQTTKRLIKELIKIKECAELSLKEKQEENSLDL